MTTPIDTPLSRVVAALGAEAVPFVRAATAEEYTGDAALEAWLDVPDVVDRRATLHAMVQASDLFEAAEKFVDLGGLRLGPHKSFQFGAWLERCRAAVVARRLHAIRRLRRLTERREFTKHVQQQQQNLQRLPEEAE